jgi:hypothetical protein
LDKHHYVYRSYEPLGRNYIGKRSCVCLPEEDVSYFGSYTDTSFSPTQKEILAICDSSEHALQVEMFFHDLYDVGRNLMFANRAKQTSKYFNSEGVPKSEETRQKMSQASLGVLKTDSHRLALSKAKKGKPVSEACRLAQIASVKGKPKSEEHRRKIAEGNTGNTQGLEARKVMSQKRTENNLGRSWWVNQKGETMFCHESPGSEWQKNRRWRG